jgi:hypothetical protein
MVMAITAPASPARAELMVKARTFIREELIPDSSAANGLLRIARQVRP